MRLTILCAVTAALVIFIVGCGGSASEEEIPLEDRVLARWHHLMERDFAGAWEFHAPGFRQVNSRDEFVRDMSGRPVRWLEADLESVSCDGDVCDVMVRVTYQVPGAPLGMSSMRVPTTIRERWIRVNGSWWLAAS